VVGRWTKIPVSRLLEGEVQKCFTSDVELHKRVIGQNEAVQRWRRPSCGRGRA